MHVLPKVPVYEGQTHPEAPALFKSWLMPDDHAKFLLKHYGLTTEVVYQDHTIPVADTRHIGQGSTWRVMRSLERPDVAVRLPREHSLLSRVSNDLLARRVVQAAGIPTAPARKARVNPDYSWITDTRPTRAGLRSSSVKFYGAIEGFIDGRKIDEVGSLPKEYTDELFSLLHRLAEKSVGVEGKPDDILFDEKRESLVVVDYTVMTPNLARQGIARAMELLEA